ncbi:MAG: hypothetical protein EPO24_12790 [Bacteroidetes bacterium]|nr:MAG: hypothetical protein EPO24_12790 [Bacteroidota bacterium]
MNEHARAKAHLYEFVRNELPEEDRQRIERHIQSCNQCREEASTLSTFFQEVDKATIDWSAQQPEEYWNTFAYSVQARITKEEPAQATAIERFLEWLDSVITFRPRDIAIAGACCILLLAGLVAGKYFLQQEKPPSQQQAARQVVSPVDSEYIRLHEYFRRSRALLVGLANSGLEEGEPADMEAEQTISKSLIHEARQLKQQPLDSRSERLISDMEKILLKLANSEMSENSADLELIRDGIERGNLLYKVRRAEAAYNQPTVMFANYKEE